MNDQTTESIQTISTAEMIDYSEYLVSITENQCIIIENQQAILYQEEQQSEILSVIFVVLVLTFVWSVIENFVNGFFHN